MLQPLSQLVTVSGLLALAFHMVRISFKISAGCDTEEVLCIQLQRHALYTSLWGVLQLSDHPSTFCHPYGGSAVVEVYIIAICHTYHQ